MNGEQSQNNNTSQKQNEKKNSRNTTSPGFQRIDSVVKDFIINICNDAELPIFLINIIERFSIPTIERIWEKIFAHFEGLINISPSQ